MDETQAFIREGREIECRVKCLFVPVRVLRLIAILHDEATHDCPLDYASLAHLAPIVPTLKGRRLVGSRLAWHQKYEYLSPLPFGCEMSPASFLALLCLMKTLAFARQGQSH